MGFVNSLRDEHAPRPPYAIHLGYPEGLVYDEVEEGRVTFKWTVAPHFTMSDGIVQGGLLGSIADTSQVMAIFTTCDAPESWLTLDLHIRFVRPIRVGEVVRVESRLVNKSRSSAIVETTFTSAEGKLQACATGGWTKPERQRDYLPKAAPQ
jgi:uncharacterized protein (TIGR00369 family)